MGVGRYGHEVLAVFLVDSGGLRVQHKGDRQETFDPFNLCMLVASANKGGKTYQLVSTMRLSEFTESAKHDLNG